MDDIKILDLYWNRAEEAIRETEKKYANYCLSIIQRILFNDENAEECLNDTFLRAWNTIPPNRPDNLRLYLGKIARNAAIDRLRWLMTQKRNAETVSFSEVENFAKQFNGIEERIDEWTLLQIINAFLSEQKRLYRIVFVQKYWYFLPVKQISELNGISESKVLSIIYRMRKKLKSRLKKEGYTV